MDNILTQLSKIVLLAHLIQRASHSIPFHLLFFQVYGGYAQLNGQGHIIYIYIYIYRERERERVGLDYLDGQMLVCALGIHGCV